MKEKWLEISPEGIVFCGIGRMKFTCSLFFDTDKRCSDCPLNHLVDKL